MLPRGERCRARRFLPHIKLACGSLDREVLASIEHHARPRQSAELNVPHFSCDAGPPSHFRNRLQSRRSRTMKPANCFVQSYFLPYCSA